MSAEQHHQYVFPDDSRWDDARQSWNLAADLRPAVVVLPATVEDVVGAVEYAAERDLKVVVQGTGHGASVHGSLDGTLLLNMREMRAVEIDAQNRRARVEAGALWEDVVTPATEQGLTALHGSSPNVGVVGYSLGGGIGWLARKHGLSAESVLAVEVVTADGTLLRADRTQNTELFWALRGGGGGLGVVVAMEIALYEVEELVAGMMIWPWERSAGSPDQRTSSGRKRPRTRSARRPGCCRSPRCRTSPSSSVAARSSSSTVQCSAARLRRTRSSLRSASSDPEIDTFGTVTPAALDPAPHGPGAADAGQVRRLPGRRPRRRRRQGDRRDRRPGTDSPLVMVELRQLGGTLRERRPGAGALGSLDGSFAFYSVGVPMGPGATEAIESRIDAIKGALSPWSRGKTYLNFADRRDHRRCGRRRGVHAARAGQGVGRSGRALPRRALVRDGDGRGGRRGRRSVGFDLQRSRKNGSKRRVTRVSPGRTEAPSAVLRPNRRPPISPAG